MTCVPIVFAHGDLIEYPTERSKGLDSVAAPIDSFLRFSRSGPHSALSQVSLHLLPWLFLVNAFSCASPPSIIRARFSRPSAGLESFGAVRGIGSVRSERVLRKREHVIELQPARQARHSIQHHGAMKRGARPMQTVSRRRSRCPRFPSYAYCHVYAGRRAFPVSALHQLRRHGCASWRGYGGPREAGTKGMRFRERRDR